MRIAQEDIVNFCVNAAYEHRLKWPNDYWPDEPTPPNTHAWTDSITSYVRSRERLKQLAREVPDLTATVPAGKGHQTYLRAILLAADHTARIMSVSSLLSAARSGCGSKQRELARNHCGRTIAWVLG
jgi:hypothetical protein